MHDLRETVLRRVFISIGIVAGPFWANSLQAQTIFPPPVPVLSLGLLTGG